MGHLSEIPKESLHAKKEMIIINNVQTKTLWADTKEGQMCVIYFIAINLDLCFHEFNFYYFRLLYYLLIDFLFSC